MKNLVIILFLILGNRFSAISQVKNSPYFTWGNATYVNLNVGDSVEFQGTCIKLLKIKNQYNLLRIGGDSLWVKVSRRTLPQVINGVRIFVADNKNVKSLSTQSEIHDLLTNDALICVSNIVLPLLNSNKYIFPISFNDGYIWEMEEDSYLFSYPGDLMMNSEFEGTHPGIDFDLNDARGIEKHWVLAFENSTVVWVRDHGIDEAEKEASVLLESESQPGIYYLYKHLYRRNLEVREGQMLNRGEPIGTVWGDEKWVHLHFSVLKSDTIPDFENSSFNVLNFFPQIFELYNGKTFGFSKSYSKGRISFGLALDLNRDEKNTSAYEDYLGKGWVFGTWNIFDKVGSVSRGKSGNARFEKIVFPKSGSACKNPDNFYTYEINVAQGVYRIRAKVGDLFLPSSQQLNFEGVDAGTFTLGAGETIWTGEKIVKVKDGKLTIRIYIDEEKHDVAGLSEIVFQRAN